MPWFVPAVLFGPLGLLCAIYALAGAMDVAFRCHDTWLSHARDAPNASRRALDATSEAETTQHAATAQKHGRQIPSWLLVRYLVLASNECSP